MAKSTHYQDAINFGKQLVSEFTHEEKWDLSMRWMAHYIGELIEVAEKEASYARKRKLQQECASIILDLWKKRAYFRGNSQPLSRLRETILVLQSLISDDEENNTWKSYADVDVDSPWATYIKKIKGSIEHALYICVLATVSEEALKSEMDWLQFEKFLSTDEATILRHLKQLLEKNDTYFKIVYTDGNESSNKDSDKTKVQEVLDKLTELHENQLKYLNQLKEALNSQKQNRSLR
jgi:hypothetical protein